MTATIKESLRDKRYQDQAAWQRHLSAGEYAANLGRIFSLKPIPAEKCGHPAQKQLELIKRIMLSSSDPEDLVLDSFLGFVTAIVAANIPRTALAGNRNPTFVSIVWGRVKTKSKG